MPAHLAPQQHFIASLLKAGRSGTTSTLLTTSTSTSPTATHSKPALTIPTTQINRLQSSHVSELMQWVFSLVSRIKPVHTKLTAPLYRARSCTSGVPWNSLGSVSLQPELETLYFTILVFHCHKRLTRRGSLNQPCPWSMSSFATVQS